MGEMETNHDGANHYNTDSMDIVLTNNGTTGTWSNGLQHTSKRGLANKHGKSKAKDSDVTREPPSEGTGGAAEGRKPTHSVKDRRGNKPMTNGKGTLQASSNLNKLYLRGKRSM